MKMKDITGMRFGRLVVIEPTNKRKNNEVLWLCKCDCGNEKITIGNSLRNGKTKSCGCLNRDNIAKAKARQKHSMCTCCGSDKYYAKGYCISCYFKSRRGTLRTDIKKDSIEALLEFINTKESVAYLENCIDEKNEIISLKSSLEKGGYFYEM